MRALDNVIDLTRERKIRLPSHSMVELRCAYFTLRARITIA